MVKLQEFLLCHVKFRFRSSSSEVPAHWKLTACIVAPAQEMRKLKCSFRRLERVSLF